MTEHKHLMQFVSKYLVPKIFNKNNNQIILNIADTLYKNLEIVNENENNNYFTKYFLLHILHFCHFSQCFLSLGIAF